MSVIIRKYGGEALASPARIRQAADQIVTRALHAPIVVVASARRGVTDHLLSLVHEVGAERASRAADRVVASGEIVSAALLAAAIQRLGFKAVALDGREAGLIASGEWGAARLRCVRPRRLRQILSSGAIPVVAGFQARRRRGLATLGRGGSDLTAVALAAALGGECELVKDVPALFTADPRLCPAATPLAQVSHQFLVDLARAGAKVCHPRAAALAAKSGIPIRITHFQDDSVATVVGGTEDDPAAVVLRRSVALLTAQLGSTLDVVALRTLRSAIRRHDAGAELTVTRDALGWRATILVALAEADVARRRAAEAGLPLPDADGTPYDALSVVGTWPGDWKARIRLAASAVGAQPVAVSRVGRRLVIVTAADTSVELLLALHREFVEAHRPPELRCSA
jgi:aspartate kinase